MTDRHQPVAKGREGIWPGDNRGPRAREAELPEPPPNRWRPPEEPPADVGPDAVTTQDEGDHVRVKLNGYSWPAHLVFGGVKGGDEP